MMLTLAIWTAASALAVSPSASLIDTPVLARSVEKGEILAASDFGTEPIPPASARGATSPTEASGKEATRRLNAGAPVRASALVTPRVIRRGEAVTIALISGGLRITSTGRALSNAAAGEPVRVVNLSTNRTLDAVAEKAGHVRIVIP